MSIDTAAIIGIIKSNISVILPRILKSDHTPAVSDALLLHQRILIAHTSIVNLELVKSLDSPAAYVEKSEKNERYMIKKWRIFCIKYNIKNIVHQNR